MPEIRNTYQDRALDEELDRLRRRIEALERAQGGKTTTIINEITSPSRVVTGPLTIGQTIISGTPGDVLYVGSNSSLAQSGSFQFDDANNALTVKAVDLSVKKSIIGTETTSSTNNSYSSILAERISTGTAASGFGVGFSANVGQNSGASAQVGAMTWEYDDSSSNWSWVLRNTRSGDFAPVLYVTSRGNLHFTPKSGGYGLQLLNVARASVSSPDAGAIIYDSGTPYFWDGAAWRAFTFT